LTALLAATALTTETASALPVGLLAKTTGSAVSPAVAALVDGGSSILSASKAKAATAMLLAVSALTGAGLWTYRSPAVALPPPKEVANPSNPAKTPAIEPVVLTGRVLDPDGKPVKGARLYSPHVKKDTPAVMDDITVVPRGLTDAGGRFRIALPRADVRPDWNASLVAAAEGYGVAWTPLPKGDTSADLTLRLVQDQPIQGRIISTEGKPLAGVRVGVLALMTKPNGRLDDFLIAWEKDWQSAQRRAPKQVELPTDTMASLVTDKDGRFRIAGVGAERVAILRIQGAGIAHASLYVIARRGFDPASVNKAVRNSMAVELRPQPPPFLFGPTFEFVAPAARILEGTVRESSSGKPVPGFTLSSSAGYDNPISAVSDKQGRYRLIGLPKTKQYLLNAEPPPDSAWLRTGARIADTEGLQPLKVDFTVARGVVVMGRVIDKTTGKGVRSSLHFAPLPDNKFFGKPGWDSYHYERFSNPTDAEGRFRLRIIPGPGVLMAHAWAGEKTKRGQEINPYKQAEFDAAERKQIPVVETSDGDHYFIAAGNSLEFLDGTNAAKRLDLAPDADAVPCDLILKRGRKMAVRIEDAEGKPLTGATVAGMSATGSIYPALGEAACTIFALDPKKPRRLIFLHPGRKLAGTLTVRGDEKESPLVRLVPTGSVTGRLLDLDGQPLAGIDIDLSFEDGAARNLYRHLDSPVPSPRTDKDGRFRVEAVVPDLKFGLSLRHGKTFLAGEPRIGIRQTKPGATLDLGDIRVKPSR
jgi:protocatechuate 3,4-dioxygenase beta subunit